MSEYDEARSSNENDDLVSRSGRTGFASNARSLGSRARVAAAFGVCVLLAGCDLDWVKPNVGVPAPARFREAGPHAAAPIGAGRDFAARFSSKELTTLVALASQGNLDLAAAAARIREADAQARMASAPLWPSLAMHDFGLRTQVPGAALGQNANGSGASNPLSPARIGREIALQSNQGNTSALRTNLYQLGLTASYEIDFWGKNENASRAAQLLANASRFDRDVVEISIISTVLNAYFHALSAQDRLRVLARNIQKAEAVQAALLARLKAGAATIVDTAQQGGIVAELRAMEPPLQETLRQSRNRLAVLVGRTPEGFSLQGGSLGALSYPRIEPGLPSEVLLRRPDVAAAEAKLAAQELSVLRARAAFFPSIKLTGQYGLQSMVLKNLGSPQAIGWQLGMQIAQPLFDGFYLQGDYESQKAIFTEFAALYRQQILSALMDTENALVAASESERRVQLLSKAVAERRQAFNAAIAQLGAGLIDVVTVASIETALFQDEDLLEQARLAHFEAATALYQALGGGWSPTTREAEVSRAQEAFEADRGPWP